MELNKTYNHYNEAGQIISTITKAKEAQMPERPYQATKIDLEKKTVDFRLMQVSPYYIIWKDGKGETVNKRQLNKLQKSHTWTTDF